MASSTDACLKNRSRGRCVAAVSLASFLLLLLLTGTGWYSNTSFKLAQVGVPRPIAHNATAINAPAVHALMDAGNGIQVTDALSSAFAPFLHIVPSQDGTALFISAGGVGELGGAVFANIGEGPSHHKDSWTMAYSDTVRSYVAIATGFTPNADDYGPINITTTLGLDTGTVDFYRDYIPASTAGTVRSMDGNLELTLVTTDTITFDTYVVVVPSYVPPGPAPQGHRFVGSTYSVRAAGALVITDKPMSLRLYYSDTILAGADPHTLAIFAWDAANKCWANLGGRLFYDQQFVSVVTSRFTTYALIAIPTWHDDFDDFGGLNFAEINNVTLGGSPENRALVLLSSPGSGTAVSRPITPTTTIYSWGSLTFAHTIDPPTTTLTVDVLSLDGTELLTNVTSGTSLAGIDSAQHPSLKLRANLSSTVAGETPALDEWRLTWLPTPCYDFDSSGQVGIADVQAVAGRWHDPSQYACVYDVVPDGTIDILDIMKVVANLDKHCGST